VPPGRQGLVEFEQCCRFDEHAALRDPVRAQEQGSESEDDSIEGGEIRGALSTAITDQQLVFEEQRLCGEGSYAPWA